MVVRAPGQDEAVLPAAAPGEAPRWGAFYADVEHEVLPVTRGLRVTLTYHLYAAGFGDVPRLPASLLRTGEIGSLTLLGVALRWATLRYEDEFNFAFALEHKYTDNTLPVVTKRDPWRDDEYRTRDPARLRGRDAVLYATLEQALRAFCGPQPGDDAFDSDDDHDERHAMPQIRIEFINIRDYRAPRDGEAPKFHIGEVHDGEWWERRSAPVIVNRDGLAELLRRSDPTRTSLYTGNEGFTAGYIYKSAVITLGAHVSDY